MFYDLLHKIFTNIWPMLAVFVVVIALLRFFYLQNHREKFTLHKELSYLCGIIYIWMLFEILTMTELNTNSGMNLTPFSEIFRYKIGSSLFKYNVLGNIIIFIPFGYIIGKYVNPKKIWPVIITTFITSIVVEFVQLNIGRSFDIDDVLLNLVGGIIGYLLFVGLSAIKKRLPDVFKSDTFYNILWIVAIILFLIYVFGYWKVVFK